MLKIEAPTTVADLMDKVEAKTGVKFYFSARSEKSTLASERVAAGRAAPFRHQVQDRAKPGPSGQGVDSAG